MKLPVERKEAVWREVLGGRDEFAKDRCMVVYKEEKFYFSEQKGSK